MNLCRRSAVGRAAVVVVIVALIVGAATAVFVLSDGSNGSRSQGLTDSRGAITTTTSSSVGPALTASSSVSPSISSALSSISSQMQTTASSSSSSSSSPIASHSQATTSLRSTSSSSSTGPAGGYPEVRLSSPSVPARGEFAGGEFGTSTAASGSLLAVGAQNETSGGQPGAGNVYLYNSTTGALLHILSSPSPQVLGEFGWSVAVSGTLVVIGAPFEAVSGLQEAGNVYLFNGTTGAPIRTMSSPNAEADGVFGISVAAGGSSVVVGAESENVNGTLRAGHAYVFSANTGSLVGTLSSPDPQGGGTFGFSVAVTGGYVLVGALDETVEGAADAGRVYVFGASTSSIIETLSDPNTQSQGEFGWSVAASGSLAVVGAPQEGQDGGGLAYAFNLDTGALVGTLGEDSPATAGFGWSVATGYGLIAVGAPDNGTQYPSGELPESGAVYVFDSTTLTPIADVTTPSGQSGLSFGWSVAIGRGALSVGDPEGGAIIKSISDIEIPGDAFVFDTSAGPSTIATQTTTTSSSVTFASCTTTTSAASPQNSTTVGEFVALLHTFSNMTVTVGENTTAGLAAVNESYSLDYASTHGSVTTYKVSLTYGTPSVNNPPELLWLASNGTLLAVDASGTNSTGLSADFGASIFLSPFALLSVFDGSPGVYIPPAQTHADGQTVVTLGDTTMNVTNYRASTSPLVVGPCGGMWSLDSYALLAGLVPGTNFTLVTYLFWQGSAQTLYGSEVTNLYLKVLSFTLA